MMGTLLEKLFVAVGVDLSGFGSEMSKASSDVAKLSNDLKRDFASVGKSWQATGQGMMKTGAVMSGAITAPLVLFGKASADAAKESRIALGQVEAALKSMGPVAGFTSVELQKMAASLQSVSTFDDDDILTKVTANLLTFGNVSGKVFADAQQAAVDLSARLGQDLQSSTIMLGKALNDPVKGITALTRVGVSFTQQQKDQVAAMVAAGDMAGAQGIILGELAKQFGGAAKAQRDATPGADATDAWREFQEVVGDIVLNVLPPLTTALTALLTGFNQLDPGVQTFIVGAAAVAAALGPVLVGVGAMVSGIGALMPLIGAAIPIISGLVGGLAGLAVAFWPVTLAVGAVAAAWYFWDDIVVIVDRVGAAVSGWFSNSVKPAIDGAMSVIRPFVDFFRDYFGAQIEGVINIVSALLRGDFSGAWQAAKEMAGKMILATIRIVETLAPGAIKAMAAMVSGVKSWIMGRLGAVFDWLKGKLIAVGKWFFDLYDAVIGHSYIPDMVLGIKDWVGKLQAFMVTPVEKATKATKKAFKELASDVRGIMDEIFPDAGEFRDLTDKISTVKKGMAAGIVTKDAGAKAIAELEDRRSKVSARMAGPGDEVNGLVDRLLPNAAKIKSIRADMATLDAAIAAGKGNVNEMKAARKELDVEMEKATRWPLTDDLRSLTDSLFPASAEITRITGEMELLNKALAAGQIDPAMYDAAMAKLDESMDKAEEALHRAALMGDEWGRVILLAMDFGQELGNSIMGGLRDFLTGKKSLGDVLRDGLTNLLDHAITGALSNLEMSIFGKGGFGEFLSKMFGSLFASIRGGGVGGAASAAGSGIGSAISSLLGAVSGGARAAGGPVLPGRAYDVGSGEKFVASAHGRILSRSDAMRAAGSGFQGQRQGDVIIQISGAMSDRDARRTGLQAGRAARMEMAKNARIQPA